MSSTTLRFVPWVRHALADTITAGPNTKGRPEFDVSATFDVTHDDGSAARTLSPTTALEGYGPGDIKSLNQKYIRRLEPRRGTLDLEPNYVPFVEFSRPELPWLFTPTRTDVSDTSFDGLQPWMCLLVFPRSDSIKIEARTSAPNPVLTADLTSLSGFALPDLTTANWWSHVQVSGAWDKSSNAFEQILEDSPERVISRMVCPIDLQAETRYLACVVPTFKRGVQAGLGRTPDAGGTELAWDATAPPDQLTLPAYFHWEFRTGRAGDFESLARRLEPFEVDESVGTTTVSVDLAEFDLADVNDDPAFRYRRYKLAGALRAPTADPPALADIHGDLQAGYEAVVNPSFYPNADALVAPPRYGRWHRGVETISGADAPDWAVELNLDPRHRGTASRGTRVVQELQEELMASAWQQVGDLETLNQLHRWGQLSRELGGVTLNRLQENVSSDYRKLHLLWPILDRVHLSSGRTPLGELRQTDLPGGIFSAAFRRASRTRGPIFKRRPGGAGHGYVVEEDLANCNLEPGGMADFNDPWQSETVFFPPFYLKEGTEEEQKIGAESTLRDYQAFVDGINEFYGDSDPWPGGEEVRAGIQDTMNALASDYFPGAQAEQPSCDHQIPTWVDEIESAIDPESTVVDYLQSRTTLPPELIDIDDPLAPVIVAPEFPRPMYAPLAENFPDLLLPGVGNIPNNTVTALETNPHFIEAYMVGLNHEMSREFLWREYPCDLRGSYFRQFWDIRGVIPQPQTEQEREELKDIEPLHTWHINAPDGLGNNFKDPDGTGTPAGRVVLLLRGELFKRYPNTIVYAVKAEWNGDKREPIAATWAEASPDPTTDINVQYADFTGHFAPDIRFFGFDMTTDEVKGSPDSSDGLPGYFFVLQQPMGRTRFGLDVADASNPDPDWSDLPDGALYISATAAPFSESNNDDGAAMAENLYQKPYRIALHADELIA